MRIKELIEELERQDPDREVVINAIIPERNEYGTWVQRETEHRIEDVKNELKAAVLYI